MPPRDYLIGDVVRLSVSVVDAAEAAIDPSALVLKIKPPKAEAIVVALGDLTHDSLGNYHHDHRLDAAGAWYYRWESSNPSVAATEGSINVQPSRFL